MVFYSVKYAGIVARAEW